LTSPANVYAEEAATAQKILSDLSVSQLVRYKSALDIIALEFRDTDEMLPGNTIGKLTFVIDELHKRD